MSQSARCLLTTTASFIKISAKTSRLIATCLHKTVRFAAKRCDLNDACFIGRNESPGMTGGQVFSCCNYVSCFLIIALILGKTTTTTTTTTATSEQAAMEIELRVKEPCSLCFRRSFVHEATITRHGANICNYCNNYARPAGIEVVGLVGLAEIELMKTR